MKFINVNALWVKWKICRALKKWFWAFAVSEDKPAHPENSI